MLLFYIRHGDPIYSPDSLTPLGKRQAEAVAKRLSLYGIDRIYASTSIRARETAQPTCEILKKEPVLLDFCHENHVWAEFAKEDSDGVHRWAFHNPEMMQKFVSKEVKERGEKWYEIPDFSEYRFREGIERVNRETDELLKSLGYEHDREKRYYKAVNPTDERIALFAHQGFGLNFLSSLLDIPYPEFSVHFDMGHTGMTVIEFKNINGIVIPKVLTLANDSHLYKEGLPTNYQNVLRF